MECSVWHVDDVIGGGVETFDRIMKAAHKEFEVFGSRVARFRKCQMERSCSKWSSTSLSLNK